MGGENPGMAGFGLITLASLGPVVALLIYGTAAVGRPIDPPGTSTPDVPVAAAQVAEASEVRETAHDVSAVAREALATAGSVLRVIIPVYAFLIAWDAMGVASGMVTVPFFMALGLSIASAVSPEARTAGLGLVMMASVGPVLSVQLVCPIAGGKRPDRRTPVGVAALECQGIGGDNKRLAGRNHGRRITERATGPDHDHRAARQG